MVKGRNGNRNSKSGGGGGGGRGAGSRRWNLEYMSSGPRPAVCLGISFAQQASVCVLRNASKQPRQPPPAQESVCSPLESGQEGLAQGQLPQQHCLQQQQQLQMPDRQALALARIFARQARRLAHRSVTRVEKSPVAGSCRRCYGLLVPGLSARVRIHSAKQRRLSTHQPNISLTCASCNSVQRVPMHPKPAQGKKFQIVSAEIAAPLPAEDLEAAKQRLAHSLGFSPARGRGRDKTPQPKHQRSKQQQQEQRQHQGQERQPSGSPAPLQSSNDDDLCVVQHNNGGSPVVSKSAAQ